MLVNRKNLYIQDNTKLNKIPSYSASIILLEILSDSLYSENDVGETCEEI